MDLSQAEIESFIQETPTDLQTEWGSLTERELTLVKAMLRDSRIGDVLKEVDFKHTPVSPREFLSNPEFVGDSLIWDPDNKLGLFPQWKEELCYVLEPDNEIYEWSLSGCFTGDTKIALLDGTSVTLADLVNRGDEEFWVYSCDTSGNIVPGKGHSARKTKTVHELLEVELDNGEKVRCTPDHQWLLRDGSYIRANALIPGTSLMPLYRDYTVVSVVKLFEESDVYDISVEGYNNFALASGVFVHNSMGAGKTTVAILALLYKIYLLSCLRDPHAYVGMAATVPIDYVLFNIDLRVSADAGLARFENILNNSDYFRDTFEVTKRRRRKGYGGKDIFDYKLELPPYLRVLEASQASHAISRDVLGGMLDEVNFVRQAKGTGSLNYDSSSKAYDLYTGLQNRIRNRFLRDGKLFGSILCLCSSAATQYDFLEQHKNKQKRQIEEAKAKGEKSHVHISEFAIYKLNPWKYGTKTFPVLIGTEQSNSRIILEEEAKVHVLAGRWVERVPEDFRTNYEADLPKALKEISGIPSEVISPLFPIREQVKASCDPDRRHPFTVESPVIGHLSGPPLESFLISQEIAAWSGSTLSPKHHPKAARVIHVDLSTTQCATGISMGCVYGYKEVPVYTYPNEKAEGFAIAPLIWMDFTLQIAPPPSPEEIGYEKIHAFILYLRGKLGFNISMVSFDGFQSTFLMQILQNEGFQVENLSLDKTPDPYFALKGAVLESRLNRYEYSPLEVELYGLRLLSEGKKVWIEKTSGGSKDVADTLGGVVHWCTEMTKANYSPSSTPPPTPQPPPLIRL